MNFLKLESKKEPFFLAWTIHRPIPPSKVLIPLKQFSGAEALPCVDEGQKVLTGQVIALPKQSSDVSLHASVSGKISRIFNGSHPVLGKSKVIEIISDGLDEKVPSFGKERAGWEKLTREEILKIFSESGLIDMTLTGESLHRKLDQKSSTLILNACESQPYLASNYCLMMSHPPEILKGAEILRKVLGVQSFTLVTEEDKREAAELFKSKVYFLKWDHADIVMLPQGYPDDEKILAKRLQRNSAVTLDVAAAYAVYEAVVLQKPLIERVITVGGECVVEPKNLSVRLGADLQTVFKYCKGLMREPRKVIMGGPMAGVAQVKLDAPVTAGTSGLLALPKEVAKLEDVSPCIRCGKCIEVCPVDISPAMISLAAENDLFKTAQDYGVGLCIECGNCSYVCPSKRPMTELMKYAASAVN